MNKLCYISKCNARIWNSLSNYQIDRCVSMVWIHIFSGWNTSKNYKRRIKTESNCFWKTKNSDLFVLFECLLEFRLKKKDSLHRNALLLRFLLSFISVFPHFFFVTYYHCLGTWRVTIHLCKKAICLLLTELQYSTNVTFSNVNKCCCKQYNSSFIF